MKSPTDWIPPSGQQVSQSQAVTRTTTTTPSPQDQQPRHKRKLPPTPDFFPSPITELNNSGRKLVQTWADNVGLSPQPSAAPEEEGPKRPKQKPPEIRKLSNVQPGRSPQGDRPKQTELKVQSNGIALPQQIIFDPWNACTTGHQRAENRLSGSTSWRESRERKLKSQFSDTTGAGGKRLFDTVGANSENFGKDGRKANGGWEKGAPGLRGPGQKSIVDCFRGNATNATTTQMTSISETSYMAPTTVVKHEDDDAQITTTMAPSHDPSSIIGPSLNGPTSKVLQGTVVYINGSTYPIISDHLLRQTIVQNGGAISIGLARRSVTHVILTHKYASSLQHVDGQSAGGGLAVGKIRKEVERKRAVGVGVKYVTAHWAIESIKAGKRLPEGRFADWRFVERGQEDVRGFFGLGKASSGPN
jgi:hypothetical protein